MLIHALFIALSLSPQLPAQQPSIAAAAVPSAIPPESTGAAPAVVKAPAPAAAPSSAPAASPDYVIGPQDVLTINFFDQADMSGKYTVETDGTFTFPLIGRVKAAGLTLRAFEGTLRHALADGYFKDPQLSVSVDQYRSQQVFVMGEVRAPGPVPLTGGMSLIEALARAGSPLPSAGSELSIVRAPQGASGPVLPGQVQNAEVIKVEIKDLQTGSIDQQIELHDGDTLFVPRADNAYVFGQVKNPGAYGILSDTTVLQALSLAGGVTENGAMNRIKIIRLENGEKKEIKVKLTDIVKPGDTIVVPERYF